MDPYIAELDQESASTLRLLERVPESQLAWRPHSKSMSLGQLALHVAGIPGIVTDLIQVDEVEPPSFADFPEASSRADVLEEFETSLARAKTMLAEMDEQAAMSLWSVVGDGQEMMSVPRVGLVRSIMLNHLYHHRGELVVYLRLLDVPIPAIYGASADENLFAPAAE